MKINLEKLNYKFVKKPLLVGGKAMEYYGLRKAGEDIDFIANEKDVVELIKLFPNRVKNLWGDLGVCPFEFEIWNTIHYFGYEDLLDNTIEEENFLVISEEKLLWLKVLAIEKEKYLNDSKLLFADILKKNFSKYEEKVAHNKKLLEGISSISYIEKSGSEVK